MFRDVANRFIARWQLAKLRSSLVVAHGQHRLQLEFPEFADVLAADAPRFEPYERLADVYDDYLKGVDYRPIVKHVFRVCEMPLRSILDLGCGTGMRTAPLSAIAPRVVGLDSSEAMLSRARSANGFGCSYIQGSLQTFDLGQKFDAVICATDVMNYVRNTEELKETFFRIAKHLRVGGYLFLDALPAADMKLLNDIVFHFDHNGRRFVMCSAYDEDARVDTTRVAFRDGVEHHVRIPLETEDIKRAASETGFNLEFWWKFYHGRCGYALRYCV